MVKLMSGAKRLVAFCNLQHGDTFIYGELVWIKTETLKSVQDDACYYNAVSITDGIPGCFDDHEEVYVVDIEATIK